MQIAAGGWPEAEGADCIALAHGLAPSVSFSSLRRTHHSSSSGAACRSGIDRIIGAHWSKDTAQDVYLRQLVLRRDQFFFPRAGLHDVDGREGAFIGDFPVEHDFRVTGTFEFLEDDFVHAAARINQGCCNDGQRAAVFDVPRSTEKRFGRCRALASTPPVSTLPEEGPSCIAGETRDRVEQDDDIPLVVQPGRLAFSITISAT